MISPMKKISKYPCKENGQLILGLIHRGKVVTNTVRLVKTHVNEFGPTSATYWSMDSNPMDGDGRVLLVMMLSVNN